MSEDALPPVQTPPAPAPAPVLPEPASWQLLQFIAGRVRLITKANGCHTNLGGGGVITGDEQADTDDGQADTIIVMTNLGIGSSASGHLNSDATVVIEAALPREPNICPRLLSHRVTADLRAALTVKERELPRFIRTLTLTDCQLVDVVDDAGSGSIVVQATARAGLTDFSLPAITPTP